MSDLWRKPATELADMVKTREVSALEVVEATLERLQAVNPVLNAVIAQMPGEAREAARKVDASLQRGEEGGPLAGVPVTVKVNVDQAGHTTTNGLRLQRNLLAERDNPVVANLRKAGAVIVGRTNTPAFSLRWFTRNGVHGHTRNPRNRALTPGGSSGGAAAAVAVGIGAIAHGTDIAGSIRYPAYACGVHGLRPTLGRIPSMNFTGPDRHVGAQLMAVSGPIARSVDDLRLGLQAMAREDLRDPWWTPVPLDMPLAARRVALCVAPEGLEVAPEVAAALADAAARLADAGWLVEERACPPLREPAALQARLWLSEFRRSQAAAVREEADADASFVYQQMVQRCPAPDLDQFMDTLQERARHCRDWQLFLAQHPVLLCPVSAQLPFPDLKDVESEQAFAEVMEAQLLQIAIPFMGLPGLTVSTDLVGTTPVGVQLVGGRYQEATLLAAAKDIEARGVPPSPVDPAV